MDYYIAKLQGPEYRLLSDLGLIRHDLDEVLQFCDEIEKLLPDGNASLTVRALWSAAIVTYWRCFKARQTTLKKDVVFGDDEKLLAAHHRIGTIRDKVIAHPRYFWEDGYATVTVCRDAENQCRIVDPTPQWGGSMVVHSASTDIHILRTLAQRALAHVGKRSLEEAGSLRGAIAKLGMADISEAKMPKAGAFKSVQ